MKKLYEICKDIPVLNSWLEPKPKVAVIRMAGVIADMRKRGSISYTRYEKIIEKAFDASNVKAVALVINSPGGAPAQCSLMSAQIRRLAEEKEIPVYAFVEDVAASGGYWLACCADEIYAQESSIVGSIGVISAGFGLEDFIKRYDIKRRVHTSGTEKSFLDPFLPEKADDLARLKNIQQSIHDGFKSWVKERRGKKLKGKHSDLLEGGFWVGLEAKKKGLIDDIGDLKTVLKEKLGDKAKFVDFSPEKLLPSFLPFGAKLDFDKEDWIEAALNKVEDRAYWSRYGL